MSKKSNGSVGTTHQLEALRSMDPCVQKIIAVSSPVSAAVIKKDSYGNPLIGQPYSTGACFIVARRGYPAYQLVLMGDKGDVYVGLRSTWSIETVSSAVVCKIIINVPSPLSPVEADSYFPDTFTEPGTSIAFSFSDLDDANIFLKCITTLHDEVSSAHAVIKEGISRSANDEDVAPAGKGKGKGKQGAKASTTPALSPSPSGGRQDSAASTRRQPTILPKPSSRSSVHNAARALAEASRVLSIELAKASGNPPQTLLLQAQVVKVQIEALVLEASKWEADCPSPSAAPAPTGATRPGNSPAAASAADNSPSDAGTKALIDAAASSLAGAAAAGPGKKGQGKGKGQDAGGTPAKGGKGAGKGKAAAAGAPGKGPGNGKPPKQQQQQQQQGRGQTQSSESFEAFPSAQSISSASAPAAGLPSHPYSYEKDYFGLAPGPTDRSFYANFRSMGPDPVLITLPPQNNAPADLSYMNGFQSPGARHSNQGQQQRATLGNDVEKLLADLNFNAPV